MRKLLRRISPAAVLFLAWPASSGFAQEQAQPAAPASFNVKHVIGLEGIKHDTNGKVTVSKGTLEFATGPTKSSLATTSVQEVLTGADSQRLVGGTLGFLSGFAPYESGRFLSLFRTKIDTITIQYRDSDGGLHGVIFTLSPGQAAALKKQLLAEGAKTSISVEDEAKQQAESKKAKEKKP
jgi:hypothetical protein